GAELASAYPRERSCARNGSTKTHEVKMRISHRRRAVGVERLDRLQAPGLALLAFLLGPHDRLPVGRKDEACTGIGDFDAVAAGLVDIEEEGLLDRVLVRAGLDVHPVLQEDIG